MIKKVAFTGYRPSKFRFGYNESAPLCEALKKALYSQIVSLYQQGARQFFTGCAMGVDLWAGEIVVAMIETGLYPDLELRCCVPYVEQANNWPPEMKMRHHTLLSKGTSVIYTSSVYNKAAFFIRNCYMVENSDLLIAVYNEHDNQKSGTEHTVSYAKAMLRPIIFIDPNTAHVSTEYLPYK